jgi:hypothetical protein
MIAMTKIKGIRKERFCPFDLTMKNAEASTAMETKTIKKIRIGFIFSPFENEFSEDEQIVLGGIISHSQ